MKEIKLKHSIRTTFVDDSMFDELNKLGDWKLFDVYVICPKRGMQIIMHRYIMKAPKGVIVDHIDGNPLNNQRSNLRLCNKSQNGMNRGKQNDNTSGYKGVSWLVNNKKWMAKIQVNTKQIYIGSFNLPEEAAIAYNEMAIKHHGEFAQLNKLEDII